MLIVIIICAVMHDTGDSGPPPVQSASHLCCQPSDAHDLCHLCCTGEALCCTRYVRFECLICMCLVFLYLHLFSAIEHVSHGKAL